GKKQAAKSATTRWALLAAQQSDGGRSGGAVDALCATDADRGGVSLVEKRPGDSADLPPVGEPRGRPHPDCVLGLLSPSHPEKPLADTRARSDANGGAGTARRHSDD